MKLILFLFFFCCSGAVASSCPDLYEKAAGQTPSVFSKILANEPEKVVYQNDHWFVLFDPFPARPGHALIVPKRQFPSYFEINQEEWLGLNDAIQNAKRVIQGTDFKAVYTDFLKHPPNEASKILLERALKAPYLGKTPNDFTIAVNEGILAGRTVDHLHIHMVPRYAGDVQDPIGGFRHMFPGDGNYQKISAASPPNAIEAAFNYYNNEKSALSYFRKIRSMRQVMPYLAEWEKSFPKDARVLEVGFGPGIEYEHLIKQGYAVDGLDLSEPMKIELERLLDRDLGYEWRNKGRLFPYPLQKFNPPANSYDRIWASATFLHVDKNEMPEMIEKYVQALKPGGEMYVNFKVGHGLTFLDGEGRPFSNYTAESFRNEVLAKTHGVHVKSMWLSDPGKDALGRAETQWLQMILTR